MAQEVLTDDAAVPSLQGANGETETMVKKATAENGADAKKLTGTCACLDSVMIESPSVMIKFVLAGVACRRGAGNHRFIFSVHSVCVC